MGELVWWVSLSALICGWFIGYASGYIDKINFGKPYWDWHLEQDKRWKKHVAKEYKKWKKEAKS